MSNQTPLIEKSINQVKKDLRLVKSSLGLRDLSLQQFVGIITGAVLLIGLFTSVNLAQENLDLRQQAQTVPTDPRNDGQCKIGYYTNHTYPMYFWRYPEDISSVIFPGVENLDRATQEAAVGYISPFSVSSALPQGAEFRFLKGIGGVEYEFIKGDLTGIVVPGINFGTYKLITERATAEDFSDLDILFIGEQNQGLTFSNDFHADRRDISIPALIEAIRPNWQAGMGVVMASDHGWGADGLTGGYDLANLTVSPLLNGLASTHIEQFNGSEDNIFALDTRNLIVEQQTGNALLPFVRINYGISTPGAVVVKPGSGAQCLYEAEIAYRRRQCDYGTCKGTYPDGHEPLLDNSGNMELPNLGDIIYDQSSANKFCLLGYIPEDTLGTVGGASYPEWQNNGFLIMDANAGTSVERNMNSIIQAAPDCAPQTPTATPTNTPLVTSTPTPTPSVTPPNVTDNPTDVIGPVCTNVTMQNLSTTNTNDPINVGHIVSLRCTEVTGASRYEFRFTLPDGSIVDLSSSQTTPHVSQQYVISQLGTHAALCRPCANANDSSCAPWQ